MIRQRKWSGRALVTAVAVIGMAGVLTGVTRAVLLDGPPWWRLLNTMPLHLLPLGILSGITLTIRHRHPHLRRPAAFALLASALTGAGVSVAVLHPEHNQDANIGLGLYALFGWLFPLGPVYLLSVVLTAPRRRSSVNHS